MKCLQSIRQIINEKYRERIHLEVIGQGDNTVNLFEKAKTCAEDSSNGYKHVWVVYDTDDFPAENIDIVSALCRDESNSGCQYHAIWSNQCIELWFLLHFSFMHSDLYRNEYYSKLSENLNALSKGNYVKNRNDMFSVLQPYMDVAIRNAKALDEINKIHHMLLPGQRYMN